jgi:Ala-tRNA(Pro) deacylase
MMLPRLVEYLRSNGIPFRLESYPSPEKEPAVAAQTRPRSAVAVDTRVLLVNGRPAIGCMAIGEELNLAGLRNSLGVEIVDAGSPDDLPWFAEGIVGPLPPFGRLFGVPLFVDERVADADVISFAAFSTTDFVEIQYDDLARLEQPRVCPVGIAGELAPAMH